MSRGIKNNNPLNIRRSTDRWEGALIEQTDKSFVQFKSMAYGYRAAWKVLESYWNHFHRTGQPFTPSTLIGRWAPPEENDTQIKIDIGPRGVVFNGRGMSFKMLDDNIKKLAASSTKSTVLVRCTLDSPHGFLVHVLDICNKYKMYNLSIFSM